MLSLMRESSYLNQTRKCEKWSSRLHLAGYNVTYSMCPAMSASISKSESSVSCLQAEFQRLALGFKCDMFTLEKRLRLEERSRDLAEENVRREVSSCQGLLQVSLYMCVTFQISVDGALV